MQKNSNLLSNRNILILFLVMGFLIFGNGLTGDFVHDDILVLSHSFFDKPSKILGFFGQPYFEGVPQSGLYRPLTQLSFALNYLFSSSPFGFHLVNLLLHIFNSILVYKLLTKLTRRDRFSLISALLFLVLPIHVEAVTSIVGRAEVLSFLLGILALLLWLDSKYLISAVSLFLALLAKESAIAVVAIAFLLGRHYKRSWYWLIWYLTAVGIYFAMRFCVLGEYFSKVKVEFIFNPLAHSSFSERVFTALKVLALYIQKIFIPYDLSPDYSYDQIPVVTNLLSSPLALMGLVILGSMFFFVYQILMNKKGSILAWASVLFLMPYLVISNLILPIGTIMAERLTYFSSLGAIMILALVFDRFLGYSNKMGMAVLAIILFIYGLMVVNQNGIWVSREVLLADSFKKSPNSIVAKTNYGILILEKYKELAKRLSLEVYEKYPDYVQNLNLRAAVEIQAGNFPEAEKFLERALELRPKHQNTLQNLSRVYFSLGKYKETEETLKILVSEYGGTGNVIFYALVQSKNRHFEEARQTIYNFFGPDITDESALKIISGNYKDLEKLYTYGD